MSWFSWFSGRSAEPPTMSNGPNAGPGPQHFPGHYQHYPHHGQQHPECHPGGHHGRRHWKSHHHTHQDSTDFSPESSGRHMGPFGAHTFQGGPHHRRGCGQERQPGWFSWFEKSRHNQDFSEAYGPHDFYEHQGHHLGHQRRHPWHHGHYSQGYRGCH